MTQPNLCDSFTLFTLASTPSIKPIATEVSLIALAKIRQ